MNKEKLEKCYLIGQEFAINMSRQYGLMGLIWYLFHPVYYGAHIINYLYLWHGYDIEDII